MGTGCRIFSPLLWLKQADQFQVTHYHVMGLVYGFGALWHDLTSLTRRLYSNRWWKKESGVQTDIKPTTSLFCSATTMRSPI